jgi:8-oxo-dGTP pyrophosphatase MutT (NUDIX family)
MAEDMIEEMIEEIDWEGNTVAAHPKSRLKQHMFPHKASLVIPRCPDGRYLISKRAAGKEPFPGTWVCAIGGKVAQGESYSDAAVREGEEEAGARLDVEYVTEFRYDRPEYQAIFQIFTTKGPVDKDSLSADPSEIEYFREVYLHELAAEVDAKPEAFAPTFRAAVEAFVAALGER